MSGYIYNGDSGLLKFDPRTLSQWEPAFKYTEGSPVYPSEPTEAQAKALTNAKKTYATERERDIALFKEGLRNSDGDMIAAARRAPGLHVLNAIRAAKEFNAARGSKGGSRRRKTKSRKTKSRKTKRRKTKSRR
jgi:hypothetical protein